MSRPKNRVGKTRGRSRPAPPPAVSPAALRLAVPALVVLFSAFAWTQRGVYEDGFFYLRVVDVFLHSGVLAYNPAERYETNTDFLWTLLLIPGPAAGMDDILWMHIVGVAVYAAALFAAFSLARKLLSDLDAALVALVLLGGHYSFAHFATTGFAPHLQALAALCCLLALMRFGESPSVRSGAALGFALLFLALCRLDSAVFGIPLVLCALFLAWKNGKAALPAIALAMGIPSVLFGGVLLWKMHYYGSVFPATYYAKVSPVGRDFSDTFFHRGLGYVALYWSRYFLWLFAGIAVFGAWQRFRLHSQSAGRRKREATRMALLWTIAAMSVLWHAYMLRTGGDITEFRFLMPQAPLLAILTAAGLRGIARRWRWTATVGAVCLSLLHWHTPPASGNFSLFLKKAGMLSMTGTAMSQTSFSADDGLSDNLEKTTGAEVLTAQALAKLFAPLGKYSSEVKIAMLAGGRPAYESGMHVVEMYGWADARISNGSQDDVWNHDYHSIGHSIVARPRLLARLGVNLVYHGDFASSNPPDFSRPLFAAENPRLTWATAASASFINQGAQFRPDSQLFALSLEDGRFMPILYLVRNATIDRVLDERGIERVDVFQ